MRSAALLVIAIAACSGDEPPPAQNNCTGAVYDKCSDEHNCTGMNCRPFGPIQVCTQICSDSAPCPNDEMGNAVACNGGLCQPAAANDCKLTTAP